MKIDKDGWLWIRRAGMLNKQFCPMSNTDVKCGDWCPLFGEPEVVAEGVVVIEICQEKILRSECFTDERREK